MNWLQSCPWQPALLIGLLALYLICSAIAAILDDLDLRRDQRYQARHPWRGDWK